MNCTSSSQQVHDAADCASAWSPPSALILSLFLRYNSNTSVAPHLPLCLPFPPFHLDSHLSLCDEARDDLGSAWRRRKGLNRSGLKNSVMVRKAWVYRNGRVVSLLLEGERSSKRGDGVRWWSDIRALCPYSLLHQQSDLEEHRKVTYSSESCAPDSKLRTIHSRPRIIAIIWEASWAYATVNSSHSGTCVLRSICFGARVERKGSCCIYTRSHSVSQKSRSNRTYGRYHGRTNSLFRYI